MAYQRVHKSASSWNPAFHQDHSESQFKPRPYSVQPEPDTEESEQQEIPAYSRADRDAISAKLLESMGGNIQTQTEAQVQKSSSEPEELDSEEMSNETKTLQRLSGSAEAGADNNNLPNGGTLQRLCDKCESEQQGQQMEPEGSEQEMSPLIGAIQRQEESSQQEEDKIEPVQTKLVVGAAGDKYEQEADFVAEQVMSMEAPTANQKSIQRQSEEEKEQVQRSPLAASITPLIQRDCGENMSCPEDMMSSSVSEEPNASYSQEEPNASYSQEEPNASYSQETTAIDDTRSAGEHVIRTTLRQTALRDIYLRGDAAIRAEAQAMVAAGKSEVEAARWAVQARNQLRQSIRDQGEPIVDAIAQARRGARDMPTYESLRARGRTDAQIIESAGRSNAGVNRWVGRIRIAGRILIAVDIGIGVYNVATAPEVDRPRVLAREVGRVGGALAGGWAGAKGGAAVGGFIGSFFGPGPGTAIGAGIGGVLGGIGGAIGGGWAGSSAAEWAIEEFYPPAETRFEGSFE